MRQLSTKGQLALSAAIGASTAVGWLALYLLWVGDLGDAFGLSAQASFFLLFPSGLWGVAIISGAVLRLTVEENRPTSTSLLGAPGLYTFVLVTGALALMSSPGENIAHYLRQATVVLV